MSLELLGTMAECVSRDDRCSAPLSRGPSCGDGFDSSRYGAGLGFPGIDGHGLDALTTKVTLEPRIRGVVALAGRLGEAFGPKRWQIAPD